MNTRMIVFSLITALGVFICAISNHWLEYFQSTDPFVPGFFGLLVTYIGAKGILMELYFGKNPKK